MGARLEEVEKDNESLRSCVENLRLDVDEISAAADEEARQYFDHVEALQKELDAVYADLKLAQHEIGCPKLKSIQSAPIHANTEPAPAQDALGWDSPPTIRIFN